MTEPPSKAAAARTSGRQRRAVGAPKPPPVPVAAVEPPPAKPVLSHASIAGSKASHDFAQIGRGAEPALTPTEVRNCALRCPLRRNVPTAPPRFARFAQIRCAPGPPPLRKRLCGGRCAQELFPFGMSKQTTDVLGMVEETEQMHLFETPFSDGQVTIRLPAQVRTAAARTPVVTRSVSENLKRRYIS
jgi:hypothetical protein